MLVYTYLARRERRREKAVEAEHNAPQQADTPRLKISDLAEDEDEDGEKNPTSPTDGLQSSGAKLSPTTRTGPAPGLTPLDSYASSVSATQHHGEHPDVRG